MDLSAFQKVKQLLGDRPFLLVVFCKYTTPELSENTLGARRAGPRRQRRSISGVWRTGAPTSPGHRRTVSFFFFFCNFPHPVHPNPPQSRVQSLLGDAGAGPTWRSGDSPARVVAAAGRQVREGEAGAARRATRELGVAKGLGLWGDGGRWPRLNLCGAACRAATPSAPARATPWAQGASRDWASWAVGVGRAHPAPRGSAPPLASALGAGARGLPPGRGAPGPDADRKRPRPSRAAVWAGRGRVGGAQPCALGWHPRVFSSAESLGVGLSCWVRGVQVPPTAGP